MIVYSEHVNQLVIPWTPPPSLGAGGWPFSGSPVPALQTPPWATLPLEPIDQKYARQQPLCTPWPLIPAPACK